MQVVNPSNVSVHAEDEILVLEFDETLPQEETILDIEFQGTLNDQMKGFYRRYMCCFFLFTFFRFFQN
jgi:hypothetical protein